MTNETQTEKFICPWCKRKVSKHGWVSMLKGICNKKDCKLKQRGKD